MPLAQLRTYVLPALAALALAACSSDNGGDVDPDSLVDSAGTPLVSSPMPDPALGPTATPAPGAALTPQPGVTPDLIKARQFEAEGNLQAAADIYVAAAASSTSTDRVGATTSAARALLELEKPSDVQLLLEGVGVHVNTGPATPLTYLLARSYAAQAMWQQSLAMYDRYVASGRAGVPYAYLDRARVLLELNQPLAAATSAQTGLEMGVPGSQRRTYRLLIAQSYERAGSFADAIRWYGLFMDGSELGSDDALALSRIAAIKREQGDTTAATDLRRIMVEYPSTSQALTELKEALARGEAVDGAIKGLIYYRANDYTSAEPAFREKLTAEPNAASSAEAYYYLGAIQENRGEIDVATANYARATATNPASIIADDALWWRARILEDADKLDDARALFARIVAEYPNSSWAAEAAFRRGMLSYKAKRYQEANDVWAQTPGVADAQRVSFWRGKALLRAGQQDAANALLRPLAESGEDDYYGIRARGLLDGDHGLPEAERESRIESAETLDRTGAETWLSQRTGRPISETAWNTDPRWLRAQELWTVGRTSQGDGEVFDLMESYAQDPIAMYTLSSTLLNQGRIGMSGRAGQRMLRVLNTNPNQGLPKYLLSLSYPLAFGQSAQRYAQADRISPLLLLAFVRQESFFDPRAVSPVGALGLTQVLPSTGQALADKLGIGMVDEETLLHADLNLRLGSRYMADQLRTFENEIYVAFAAYNAGPNAATRWRKASGDDADVFVETIEYTESRLYVELVAENYAIYRYLYGGEPFPNLPD